MAEILVVDDDDFFRSTVKLVIERQGHNVSEAPDGKSAQHMIGVKAFDLVISDIRMPKVDGFELLKWTREKGTTPVVLMTGFAEVMDSNEAISLGARDLLLKPFEESAVLKTINDTLETPSEIEINPSPKPNLDNNFRKVGIQDFVSGSELPYNIFIRINSKKFLKIAEQGSDVSLERLKSYQSKDVSHLYLKREDFERYLEDCISLSDKVASASFISPQKKNNFLKHTGELILDKIFVDGVDEDTFQAANGFVKSTLNVISSNDEAFNLLMLLNSQSDIVYAHSVGVSIYAVMLAKQMGWKSAPITVKVAIAGLFHDIGKKEIDRQILDTPRTQMSQEQRAILETHPVRGGEILSQVNGLPFEVAQVALQHHEEITGFGYPDKLVGGKISNLSKLISVANVFCEYALKGPESPGIDGKAAIKKMITFKKAGLYVEYVEALKKVFHYQ